MSKVDTYIGFVIGCIASAVVVFLTMRDQPVRFAITQVPLECDRVETLGIESERL